jgi:HD-GYP domain-containing protein (c-di-GMP phosphodiesterase class II)
VRSSSEHFDGSGYPDGLTGEAIPLGARAIAVAVAFAALTEQRPGREPAGPAEALAELRRNSGTQFDPRIVEALAMDLAEEASPAPAPV